MEKATEVAMRAERIAEQMGKLDDAARFADDSAHAPRNGNFAPRIAEAKAEAVMRQPHTLF